MGPEDEEKDVVVKKMTFGSKFGKKEKGSFFLKQNKFGEKKKEGVVASMKGLLSRKNKGKKSVAASNAVGSMAAKNRKQMGSATVGGKIKAFFSKKSTPVIIGVELLIKPDNIEELVCGGFRASPTVKEDIDVTKCEKKVTGRFGKFAASFRSSVKRVF